MAIDAAWWRAYKPEFAGERVTLTEHEFARKVKVRCNAMNSGVAAMMLAERQDADKIILLGFDFKYGKGGKRHWHADHVNPMGNAGSVNKWVGHAMQAAKYLANIDVVNCTRDTDLKIFRMGGLEEELC